MPVEIEDKRQDEGTISSSSAARWGEKRRRMFRVHVLGLQIHAIFKKKKTRTTLVTK